MRTISDSFLKSERGSASVIEATIVYPIVILTVTALIYIGMYMYDSAVLTDKARLAADMTAKTVTFAGYDKLGDIYSGLALDPGDTKPGTVNVSNYYRKSSPYRYFVTGKADARVSKKVSDYAADGLFRSSGVKCTVNVKRRIFDREVTVTVEKGVSLPGVFKMIGIGRNRKIVVSASAVTSDPAEFVRNTDLAVDAATFIGDKTGLSKKLSEVQSRLGKLLEKLKAGAEK